MLSSIAKKQKKKQKKKGTGGMPEFRTLNKLEDYPTLNSAIPHLEYAAKVHDKKLIDKCLIMALYCRVHSLIKNHCKLLRE